MEHQENEDKIRRALASQKSFVTPALLTFLLYVFFYLPGLIFNIIYLQEAEKTARISGEKPSGMGCLQVMLYLQVAAGILVIILFVLLCSLA